MILHGSCIKPRKFSAVFSHLVNSFLNLLCHHEFVLSTTHLLAGFPFFMRSQALLLSSPLFFLFDVWKYPHLIISCFAILELYDLSRHRCCFIILFFVVEIVDVGRLITVLHITSVTAFTS